MATYPNIPAEQYLSLLAKIAEARTAEAGPDQWRRQYVEAQMAVIDEMDFEDITALADQYHLSPTSVGLSTAHTK